jgi:hypothetical protein
MKRIALKMSISSVSLMLILFSCASKDKITLEYNLKQGETLGQNVVMNMDMVQKLMNQEIKISMAMNVNMAYDVRESRDDGYTLEVKYRKFRMDMGMPTGNISFDSNTSEDIATPQNLSPMFKAIIDKPFDIVMTKTGKVKSVTGLEIFNEAMLAAIDGNISDELKQQAMQRFGSQFSEESVKSSFEQNTGYLPEKSVGIGDSWTIGHSTALSDFALNIEMKMTLKSIDDNVLTLDADGQVSTPEGYEQEMNGMKVKVNLKGTQKGSLKINRDTGWIISSEVILSFNGNIDIMGMTCPVYAVSTITVTGD